MALSKRTYNKKFNAQHGRCYYCGINLDEVKKIEIDHILPYSKYKNGQTTNLCLACLECNKSKGKQDPIKFKEQLLKKSPHKLIRGMFYYEFIKLYYNNTNE